MGKFAAFAAVAVLLLCGCAFFGAEPAVPPEGNNTAAQQEQPPVQVAIKPPEPLPPEPEPEQPAQAEPCTVEFQRDTSNIMYVLVKTKAPVEVTLTCPNGQEGVRQNGLFFCSQLDLPSPAIAYAGGRECGRANFTTASPSPKPASKPSCSLALATNSVRTGGEAYVTAKVYAPGKSTMVFNCGDSNFTQTVEGLSETVKLCRFSEQGAVEVYLELNGEKCASKIMGVG